MDKETGDTGLWGVNEKFTLEGDKIMMTSLRKSYKNMKNGNWDDCRERGDTGIQMINNLVTYQIEELCYNEEDLTERQYKSAVKMINELIDYANQNYPELHFTHLT